MQQKKLVIFGYTEFAEIAYEYFTHDSDYEVVGFCVYKDHLEKNSLFNLPIVPFEEVESHYAPSDHFFFAASVYTKLNRLRTQIKNEAKAKGYQLASYVSSRSFVWRNVKLGEHVFIFEDNTIQPFVTIGDNVVLWSGNHIGHHSTIDDNCFISSHVVVSGGVYVGKNCFLGVNASINNAISIADDCLIASGGLVVKNIPENVMVVGNKVREGRTAREHFNV